MARILALAALIAAVALAALAMFGGADAYKVKAVFQNAGQLVPGNEVRVGGQPIGTISDIELDQQANAIVTMEVGDAVAPLHEGTSATIRATSLSGITSRYISLKPGPNNARRARGRRTASAPTRRARRWTSTRSSTRSTRRRARACATSSAGPARSTRRAGSRPGESIQYFAPFLGSTSRLTQELALDQQVFEQFVQDGADTVSAIASRRGDLTDLVSNTNSAMRAIGDENVALQRALELLPGTLRKANTTFVNLRNTLDDLDKLVDGVEAEHEGARAVLQGAAPARARRAADGRGPARPDPLARPEQRPDRADGEAAAARGAHRERVPARDPGARPLRPRDLVRPPLHARPVGWITKFGQVAAYYDANGHYARVQPVFSPTRFDRDSNRLVGVSPTDRLNRLRARHAGPTVRAAPPSPRPTARRPGRSSGCDPSSGPPSEDPPGP